MSAAVLQDEAGAGIVEYATVPPVEEMAGPDDLGADLDDVEGIDGVEEGFSGGDAAGQPLPRGGGLETSADECAAHDCGQGAAGAHCQRGEGRP